jgi:hypothetical protein
VLVQPDAITGAPEAAVTALRERAEVAERMAKSNPKSQRDGGTLQSSDVSDQVVSQVGKATMQIVKLRQTSEENMTAAETDAERETLSIQVETAAVRAIDEPGLTVDKYNEIITTAGSDPELEQRVLAAASRSD